MLVYYFFKLEQINMLMFKNKNLFNTKTTIQIKKFISYPYFPIYLWKIAHIINKIILNKVENI